MADDIGFRMGDVGDTSRRNRRLITQCMKMFEKLDEFASHSIDEVVIAYRTIAIGQAVHKFIDEGIDSEEALFTKVLLEILPDFPIGKTM